MNRILVFMDGPESRRKRAQAAAHERCESLDALSRGIFNLFVDDDGIVKLFIEDGLEREPLADLACAESFIASELRRFAGQCLEVAHDLDSTEGAST